jgi:uncharacterized RDD family membrane protein YckC
MVMERNPYAPTQAALQPVALDEPGESPGLASRERRLANLLLDTVGFTLVSIAIGFINALVILTVNVNVIGLLGPLFSIAVLLLYYIVSESLFGRTLGKLVTGTRVVGESGGTVKLWQVVLRTLYRFVPFEAFSFLSKSRPGWHDRWSKTRVVMARRTR